MTPINFNESNKLLVKPNGMTDEECSSLPILTDGMICVSCWKMSLKERIVAVLTGKVWVMVWSGHTQPPICIAVKKPIKQSEA